MSAKADSIDDFVRHFEKFETDSGIFDLDLNGCQIYPYVRLPLYYKLTELLGLNAKQVNNLAINKSKFAKAAISSFKSILGLIIGSRSKCDVLIIEHPKKTLHDEVWIDEYSFHLVKELSERGRSVKVLVHPNSTNTELDKVYGSNVAIDYAPYLFVRKAYEIFYFRSKQVKDLSQKLYKLVLSQYPVEESLHIQIQALVSKAIAEEKVARWMLRKYNPSLVGSVVSYGHAAAFHSIAKKLGIPNFEIQHGAITKNHMGYSYPKRQIDIFPDYLLTFGEYWNNNAAFPISENKLLPVGFISFDNQRRKFQEKPKKHILFVSQNVNVYEVAHYAANLAMQLPNEYVVFRLHPKLANDPNIEGKLFGTDRPPNIEISSSPQVNIYELFSKSKLQIGVFSTAIYEGVGIGLPTVIIKLNGWKVMERMSSYKSVRFVDTQDQLLKACSRLIAEYENVNEHPDAENLFAHNASDNTLLAMENLSSLR